MLYSYFSIPFGTISAMQSFENFIRYDICHALVSGLAWMEMVAAGRFLVFAEQNRPLASADEKKM